MSGRLHLACVIVVASAACTVEDGESSVPPVDPVVFRDTIYPILLRDCSFAACHGDTHRFFIVYGPGRTRLDPATDLDAPPTTEELAQTFARAQSMLVSSNGARRGPLVRKPLAVSAGGAQHAGTDPWGGAIYASRSDPSYQAISNWAAAGGAP